MGLFDSERTPDIQIFRSPMGGFEVRYQGINLHMRASPTPAAAALEAVKIFSGRNMGNPTDLINKIADPNVKSDVIQYTKDIVNNLRNGIGADAIQKTYPQPQQQPQQPRQQQPNKPLVQQYEQEFTRISREDALDMLLKKGYDRYLKTGEIAKNDIGKHRYTNASYLERRPDMVAGNLTILVARIEDMSSEQFLQSDLSVLLAKGDIDGAIRAVQRGAAQFHQSGGRIEMGNWLNNKMF